MSWTRSVAAAAVLALLPGCAVWIETRYPARASYDVSGRPASSYYCYDCHGYRYFDPYYDWCAGYGFRYAWDRHPETISIYRQRYVRIKEENPTYGRYRYPSDYRQTRRYRQPRDYDQWRAGARSPGSTRDRGQDLREKPRRQPGSNRKKQQEWRDQQDLLPGAPRGPRPPLGERPGSSGGA